MLIKRRKDAYILEYSFFSFISYIKQLSNIQRFGEDYFLLEIQEYYPTCRPRRHLYAGLSQYIAINSGIF